MTLHELTYKRFKFLERCYYVHMVMKDGIVSTKPRRLLAPVFNVGGSKWRIADLVAKGTDTPHGDRTQLYHSLE